MVTDDTKFKRLQDRLAIDREGLSDCLIEQPQLYYDVTNLYVQAVSQRDAAKLDLEEATARADKAVRRAAEVAETKITEALIKQELALDKNLRSLHTEILELTEQVGQLGALRDAFSQRSFMLRELVALYVSERHDIARADGAGQSRADPRDALADSNKRATAPARQRFRVGRSRGES